jgi:superfamily I DNA and/or RNA helicase/tetratricopeptide (TPR) repeat protein
MSEHQKSNNQNLPSSLANIAEGSDFYFELGNDYFTQGQYHLALSNYNKAMDLNPSNPEIYHNAGMICIELEQFELAIECLEKGVKLDKMNDNSFYLLGFSFEITGNTEKAMENYKRAVDINPGNASASLAIENLNQIINSQSEDASVFFNTGIAYLIKKQEDLALEYLIKAVELSPEHAEAQNELAKLYYSKGELYLSLKHFNKAISLNPDFSNNNIYKTLKANLVDKKNTVKLLMGLRDRLNNLNPRNRSLRLMRIAKEWNFDLKVLDNIEICATDRILNSLLKDITPIQLMKIDHEAGIYEEIEGEESHIKVQKRYYNHLNTLYRKINALESETGIYDLFVGYPFVECKCIDGTYLRAPLLLNPCHLERIKDPYYGWILKTDNEFRPIINETLLMGLQKFSQLVIPRDFFELEKDIDEHELISWIIEYFKNNNIPVFVDKDMNCLIHKLPEYRKDDIPDLQEGQLYIRPYAVLGIFPQSTSNLRPDYDAMIESPDTLINVPELLGTQPEEQKYNTIIDYDEIDQNSASLNFPITTTDESQDRVLMAYRMGQNYVLHGPPGTGKSHVILNIIAESLIRNMRVLVVCQKRAALDVIYNRLQAENLSDYIALVHDHERDKKNIFSSLSRLAARARQIPPDFEINSIKQQLSNAADKIDANIKFFNSIKEAQMTSTDYGLSPSEMYSILSGINNDTYIKPFQPHKMTYARLIEEIQPLLKLEAFYKKFKQGNYPLQNRKSWHSYSLSHKETMLEKLKQIHTLNNNIKKGLIDIQTTEKLYLQYELESKPLFEPIKSFLHKITTNISNFDSMAEYFNYHKEHFESIKENYNNILSLLKSETGCKLPLFELLDKSYKITDKQLLSLVEQRDFLSYKDLNDFTEPLCSLIEYYSRYETSKRILRKGTRTSWSRIKVDQKADFSSTLSTLLENIPQLRIYADKVNLINCSLEDLINLEIALESITDLFKAIQQDKEIIDILLKWEKACFPNLNYEKILKEAQSYLSNLDQARWNIYEKMDKTTAEALNENLLLYMKPSSFLKFFSPTWWKAKKRINTILKPYYYAISIDNAENIKQKTTLTLNYHYLQRLINFDLAFIDPDNSLKESEVINKLNIAGKYFSPYKNFTGSVLIKLIASSAELKNDTSLKALLEYIKNLEIYINLFNKTINDLNNMNKLIQEEYILNLIHKVTINKDITKELVSIKREIEDFELIQHYDTLFESLSSYQETVLAQLVAKSDFSESALPQKWKQIIHDSFIKAWLNKEKETHPILKKYTTEEFLTVNREGIVNLIERSINQTSHLLDSREQLYIICNELEEYFEKTLIAELTNKSFKQEELGQQVEILINSLSDFNELVEMDTLKHSLNDLQSDLLEKLSSEWDSRRTNQSQTWELAILNGYLSDWIKETEHNRPILKNINNKDMNKSMKDLKENYEKRLHYCKDFVRKYRDSVLAVLTTTDKQRGKKKLKDLEYQVNKKRRLWSLRKLVHEYLHSHIFEMMPCWLMSPESLSAIMPYENNLFDLVIFDEASQCSQEYALPSLIRARQIIVSGDEKQLPPLNLFHSTLEDDREETIIDDASSMLSLAKTIYPTYLLSWHYRSKFEELINFSNHAFYQGNIQIAPNMDKSKEITAIEWVSVPDGLWIKGSNKKEAQQVVDYLADLLKTNPNPPTIGIISFNITQQNMILDLIDKKENEDKDFARALTKMNQLSFDDRLFVKNIENVQGDERELIIFSIGYSRDYQNKISTNFGLLNRAGGENRLNVAITRAKQKVVVFCSVQPDDFHVENAKNAGPVIFKNYLKYAQASAQRNYDVINDILSQLNRHYHTSSRCQASNIFVADICSSLQHYGYEVETYLGASDYKIDIAIKDPDKPDQFLLGIECDGPLYYESQSARSRCLTRQEFLQSRGWKMDRIWARQWYQDKEKEIKRILSKISQ